MSSGDGRELGRSALTLALAAVVLLGCGRSGASLAAASLAVAPVEVRVPAGEGAAPAPPERCPADAPWNGRMCLGGGYVACPGDARFDDAGVCRGLAGESRDAGGRARRDD